MSHVAATCQRSCEGNNLNQTLAKSNLSFFMITAPCSEASQSQADDQLARMHHGQSLMEMALPLLALMQTGTTWPSHSPHVKLLGLFQARMRRPVQDLPLQQSLLLLLCSRLLDKRS